MVYPCTWEILLMHSSTAQFFGIRRIIIRKADAIMSRPHYDACLFFCMFRLWVIGNRKFNKWVSYENMLLKVKSTSSNIDANFWLFARKYKHKKPNASPSQSFSRSGRAADNFNWFYRPIRDADLSTHASELSLCTST